MTGTGILVHCEITNGKLASISTEALGAGSILAKDLGGELLAVVIGNNVENVAEEAIYYGAKKVYLVDDPLLKDYMTDSFLSAMEKVINLINPSIVILGQSSIGRDITPRLAFRLNTAATMDCIALSIDPETKRMLQTKPVYGGNAHVIHYSESDPQIATVRSKSMNALEKDENRQGEIIKIDAELDASNIRTKLIDRKIEQNAGVKLEDATVIVSGGRGIGGPEGFEQLKQLADILKGAVGASRPPCDNKWISDNLQIGLTGKIVNPDLYIAVALSGSSQHMSGCSNSKVIVAINKDPEANIFKTADYGIVADWRKVLPAFCEKLKELIS